MQEQNLTPELRFPEFKEDWIKKSLSELLLFKNGINASREDYGRGYKFINVLDIIQNDFITHDVILGAVDVSEGEFRKNIVEYGDILFQRSSETREEVGQANVYLDKDQPATFGGFVIRGKKNADYDPIFLNSLLKTARSRKEITSKSGGSTRYNVGQDTLSEISIYTTTILEQQKSASFLTAVDKRIQLLQQKKELLETYKKGVMQKLFSQELRFKDENGNDFPDWEEKKLGEVYSFKTTNSLSREKLNYKSGTVKNIHYGDIHTKFKSHFHIGKELVPYINPNIELSRIADDNYLQEGDLVIADASEDYADIGKTIEVVNLNQEKVLAGLHTFLARRKSDDIAIGFAGHLMKNRALRLEIMRIAQGTKVLSISTTRLRNITIQLPIKAEQQKIASFLSSLDEVIEKVAQQVEHSQHFKKGLLQKMFV